MPATTFDVSPEVKPTTRLKTVDYAARLRVAYRRPIEAMWEPTHPLVQCDQEHALLLALRTAFYDHYPLTLSPDAIWLTLAHGFALHVNLHAESLRHRFVKHQGKAKLTVERPDFMPGEANPWPEAFAAFSDQVAEHTGGLSNLVQAEFTTTGPVERAVSQLIVMETFKSYFEYEMVCGCGIPQITLTGTVDDWKLLRDKARQFAEYSLDHWIKALDPILEQFIRAKEGHVDLDFWKSIFRFNSGSGPAVMTGWATVLFPYYKDDHDKLYPNPYLNDWKKRLKKDDKQDFRQRWADPQGEGIHVVPACQTAVPLKVIWGDKPTEMRIVGGLLGVSKHPRTHSLAPECGWVLLYEEPVDPLSRKYQWEEERLQLA